MLKSLQESKRFSLKSRDETRVSSVSALVLGAFRIFATGRIRGFAILLSARKSEVIKTVFLPDQLKYFDVQNIQSKFDIDLSK